MSSAAGDPGMREDVLGCLMDDRSYSLTMRRSAEEASTSKAPTFLSSLFKYYGTEQNIRRQHLMISALGTQGLGWSGDGFSSGELGMTRGWLRSKANSIEGGTAEIQLNIIAKRVLGLPE